MGKSAAHQSQQLQSEAATRYSNLATSLIGEAGPARNQVSDYYSNIIKGGPQAYAAAAPQIAFTKTQFGNAQKQLAETAPAGGAFMAGSRQLAEQKAQSVSDVYKSQINNALQSLTGIAMGETSAGESAVGGVSHAGDSLAQLAASQAAAWGSGLGGIAGGLGTFFGLGGMGGGAKPPAWTPPYQATG